MAAYFVPVIQTTYENGKCDFCKQRDVKVKPLNCKRHFYCRTCNEFSPKFKRKDFQCRTCSERCRQLANDNLQKVDEFLDSKTGGGKERNNDVTVSIDGGNIITLGKENANESDEEDGFSGNNDEWEQLLKTLTKEDEHVNDKPIGNQKTEVKLELVPRETSFIKLVLPSADQDYKNSSSNKLDIQMNDGNCWVHSPVRSMPDGNETPVQQTAPSSDESRSIFISDSSEDERCSSPIKAPKRRKPAWGWFPSSHTFADTEDDNVELLTDIEAPPDSPKFSNETVMSAKERDSFWDF